MLAGKNTGSSAFAGLSLEALPQTLPILGKRHKTGALWWWGSGRSPGKNGFSVIWSPQITSDDSKFFTCVLKSGGTVPPVQKVGVLVPLVRPVRYAYGWWHHNTACGTILLRIESVPAPEEEEEEEEVDGLGATHWVSQSHALSWASLSTDCLSTYHADFFL